MNIPNILPLWINSNEIESKNTYDNFNPYDQSLICKVSIASDEHLEEVMSVAKNAQKAWSKTSFKERAKVLLETARILRSQNDELARIETMDTARPIRETTCVDIVSACECLEYIASLIQVNSSRHIPLSESSYAYTLNRPLGVCLGIGAWNYPIQVATWKAAPAIAMGNSFVYKPSELTPVSAYFLAKAFKKAGLPDGVFQVLYGDAEVGKKLVEHKSVNKVSLTGSVPTGKIIYQNAAKDLKKVSLELGGKGPLIIFDDANIDNAVQSTLFANFYSNGQICSNGTRVFVHKDIKVSFLEKLIEQTQKIQLGDPLDYSTHLGPLISKGQYEKVTGYIERAKARGANIVYVKDCKPPFVSPVIISDCSDDMECVTDEIFGPVISLLTFEDIDEVIQRANNTDFGLAGAVFSKDITKAHSVASALEVGVSWINAYNLTPVEMPFGGAKHSGLGMENGHEVLKEYSRTQAVYVNHSDKVDPFF